MEIEFLIFSLARLGLLAFSFFALPPGLLITKADWETNDIKKCAKVFLLFWGLY